MREATTIRMCPCEAMKAFTLRTHASRCGSGTSSSPSSSTKSEPRSSHALDCRRSARYLSWSSRSSQRRKLRMRGVHVERLRITGSSSSRAASLRPSCRAANRTRYVVFPEPGRPRRSSRVACPPGSASGSRTAAGVGAAHSPTTTFGLKSPARCWYVKGSCTVPVRSAARNSSTHTRTTSSTSARRKRCSRGSMSPGVSRVGPSKDRTR